MSKKQDQIAQKMLDAYLAALNKTEQKSPEEQALSDQTMQMMNFAKSGDYRKPPPGIFYNYADPAERKRQNELISGAGARGTAALAVPNSTALMLDKQNRDAQFDEDQAANYQQNVSNAIGSATGLAGGLAQQDQARRNTVLGATEGMASQGLQYTLNKKPWWQSLLQPLIAGGAQVGAAYAGKP